MGFSDDSNIAKKQNAIVFVEQEPYVCEFIQDALTEKYGNDVVIINNNPLDEIRQPLDGEAIQQTIASLRRSRPNAVIAILQPGHDKLIPTLDTLHNSGVNIRGVYTCNHFPFVDRLKNTENKGAAFISDYIAQKPLPPKMALCCTDAKRVASEHNIPDTVQVIEKPFELPALYKLVESFVPELASRGIGRQS